MDTNATPPDWKSFHAGDFPYAYTPIWVASTDKRVRPCSMVIEEHDDDNTAFLDPRGSLLTAAFWCEMTDPNRPPPPPSEELLSQVPPDYAFGWLPAEDHPLSLEDMRSALHSWNDLLFEFDMPPYILWQSIKRDEFPPAGELVWTTHGEAVRKGRWIFAPGIPLKETAFEDETGQPIPVSLWCPLEDSPTPPPPLPEYALI